MKDFDVQKIVGPLSLRLKVVHLKLYRTLQGVHRKRGIKFLYMLKRNQ